MPKKHTMQDEMAVRQLVRDCVHAWNRRNGAAYSQPFAEDADCRLVWGAKLHGRAVIARRIFEVCKAWSTLDTQIARVRFIRSDVAFVEAVSRLSGNSNLPFEQVISAIVAVKTNDDWRILACHNAGILPDTTGN